MNEPSEYFVCILLLIILNFNDILKLVEFVNILDFERSEERISFTVLLFSFYVNTILGRRFLFIF